jgi:hypothetical protein
MAHQVCDDDPRTVAQRRADALGALAAGAERLTCGCQTPDCPDRLEPDPRAAAVVIHVVAERDALDGQPDPHTSGERPADPEPDIPAAPRPPAAHLIGGATLPASMVAELIRNGAKVRPVRHPGDAPPELGYRPSAELERFIRCRDMTCRFPGCDHPAEFADIDHTIPFPLGLTHASNLKCLCRKHIRNRMIHRFLLNQSASRQGRTRTADRPPSWHRLGPRNMPLEAKRFRHVAVAIPQVCVSRGIAVSPRQKSPQP